ncbi:hypothetical protein HF086_015313 [Spodoptera exigua]|uniref:G-protein coupled receptor Mth2 n=1 Tax=Spodoptera exigua TaxID=7107 RepID=A0A922M056_SPOEX|nr:hypothetical protein HF086_015313 [Spodoptera exigua]
MLPIEELGLWLNSRKVAIGVAAPIREENEGGFCYTASMLGASLSSSLGSQLACSSEIFPRISSNLDLELRGVDWVSDLVYFFVPVLILVICNVVFFTVTAYRIRSIRQETAILKGAESSRSDKLKKDKQRYGLYLKLFMVMGVNWTVELLSFAIGGSNLYWIITDISNIGLGVFVFLIFVWKKKVRNLVQKSLFGLSPTEHDQRTGKWNTTSTAPTEDTRISTDDSAMRLKDMH